MTDCFHCRRHPGPDADCDDHCHHAEARIGLLCYRCVTDIRDSLDMIVKADVWLASNTAPKGAGGPGGERSLPGGTDRLSWLEGSDMIADVDSWCRLLVEETGATMPSPGLRNGVTWLRGRLERELAHAEWVGEFSAAMSSWARLGKRLCGWTDAGVWIECPSPWGETTCGRRLRVDIAELDVDVLCRRCHTKWSARRLVLVASEVSDGWADADAIEAVLMIPTRTLRQWGRSGKVRRRGGQYALADVRAMRDGRAQGRPRDHRARDTAGKVAGARKIVGIILA